MKDYIRGVIIIPKLESEVWSVCSGEKPLAIIYKSKTPMEYEKAISFYKMAVVEIQRLGVVAIARNYKVIEDYRKLVSDRKLYSRLRFQYKMGRLLGYSLKDIYTFIRSDVSKTCTCVECGGEIE